jgi:hypothetical protein
MMLQRLKARLVIELACGGLMVRAPAALRALVGLG